MFVVPLAHSAVPDVDKVDIAAFLELGLGVFVGTRDAQRVPHGVSGSAVKLLSEGRAVVYVPEHECAQAVANVLDNGAIAVLFDQPTTHRGYQLKGRVTAVRAETAEEAEEVVEEKVVNEERVAREEKGLQEEIIENNLVTIG